MTGTAPALALGATVVVLLTGCGGDTTPSEPSGGIPAAPAEQAQLGTISSLRREDDRWVMRFDPMFSFTGETASVAAAEDGVVAPGEPVPNDYYRVDEQKRDYTFFVADDAEVVVLTRSGEQYGGTTIGVEELAAIVDGTTELQLFEPLDTGVWITYENDTVTRIVH